MPTIAFGPDAAAPADGPPPAAAELSAASAQALREALAGDAGVLNALHLPLLLRLARDRPADRAPLVSMLRAINRHDAIRVRLG